MPDDLSAPQPTPTNYQRTTGGSHLRWQPPTPQHLQEMLPAYEILSILGQGGMGAVYKGRQKSLDRVVAIKILPPEAGEDDMQFVERFKNEARTMAKMNHPAIVHVYDFGETTEGQLYIVMEYIDGTDVAKMIQSQGKLPEDYALSITAHVCDALGYAHTHGVVHRDIKPANVLINMEGQVKVADFGLAKATDPSQMGLTKTNMAMGTPDFVSPEALMPGVPLDGRADLYAVGVMLYNMLTGTIPRGAFRMPGITLQTDARFDKIILKAMEMDRENRYQTALDLRRDLDVILTTPAAKTGMQTIPAQQVAAQQSLPQKPMGKSPGSPQRKEGSAGTPARSSPAADKSVRAPVQPPKKSNAGVIYGIAAAVVVVVVGVFMFAGGGKKPSEVKPVAESKPEPTRPAPKPATPAAISPVLTAGWQPLFTDEDWRRSEPGKREWVNGQLRLLRMSKTKPWPSADGAIRARIHFKDGSKNISLTGRGMNSDELYKLNISNGSTIGLASIGPDGRTLDSLGKHVLPKPLQPGDTLLLELRLQGDRLTALVNGAVVIEARDTRYSAPGKWGILADDGWFESVEMQASATETNVVSAPPPVSKLFDVLTFGGHRYQVLLEPLTWPEAKAKAEAMGGHLATITSKEEADFVTKTIGPGLIGLSDIPSRHGIILGASWSAASNTWQCDTGETFDLAVLAGKRITPKGADARLIWSYRGERWDHVGNRTPQFFLVEWDDDGKVPSAPVAASTSKPFDVLNFGGHRYQHVKQSKITWDAAKAEAARMGGHLATITSQAEHDFIAASLKDQLTSGYHLFVGLSREADATDWRWVTGEPFAFSAWTAKNPDAETKFACLGTYWRTGNPAVGLVVGWDDMPGIDTTASGFLVEWDNDGSAKPAPMMPAAAPTTAGAINLLALVDVKRDAIAGDWTVKPDGLTLAQGTYGALEFQTTVPEEYDFEMEFTPQTGGNNVNQYITAQGHSFAWKLNAHGRTPPLYGFELLDGKFAKDTSEARTEISRALQIGTRHRSTIEVRKGSLRALLDGEELVKWSGDFSRFSMEEGTKLSDPKHIGVGGYKRGVVFHKAELRPFNAPKIAEVKPVSASVAPMIPAAAPTSAAPADPRLAQLESGYQARYDTDAQKPFLAAVATLNQSYVANGIGKTRAAAQAKGSLDEVTALDAEKALIEKGGSVPAEDAAGTPESLKALRTTYRTALAKITAERDAKAAPLLDLYLKALDVYVAELTKAGKIDEAKKIQSLRDDKAAADSIPPAPTRATAPAAGVPTIPADTTGGGSSSRQLAEWILTHGGNLKLPEGGKLIYITRLDQLPAGKPDIVEVTFRSDEATAAEIGLLAAVPNLNNLRIDGSKPLKLDFLNNLKKLQTLNLPVAVVDLERWPLLGGLKQLWRLDLRGRVTDAQLAQLSGLEELEHIALEFAPTGTGFAGMKASKKLRILNLGDNGSAITDEGLGVIAATFPNLENCHLATWDNPTAVTNAGLQALLPLKSLKALHVTGNGVNDGAFETLARLRGLKTLSIKGSNISADGAEKLRKALSGCNVTN